MTTTWKRITFDPQVMGGKPCIRGMRVTVGTILGLLASGRSTDEILAAHPYLEAGDIQEALAYAAWGLQKRTTKPQEGLEERLRTAEDVIEDRERGRAALEAIHHQVVEGGDAAPTLDEINTEIRASREERAGRGGKAR